MGAQLNKLPLGLLSFFDLKQGGRYPQQLGEHLAPVLEMFDWYVQTNIFTTQLSTSLSPFIASDSGGATYGWTSATPNALPVAGGQVAVPNNEIWYVSLYSVSWTWNSIAGGVMDASPMFQVPNSGSRHMASSRVGQTDSQAGGGVAGRSCINAPFWLMPGCAPRYIINRQTVPGGGSVDFSGQIQLVRFLI